MRWRAILLVALALAASSAPAAHGGSALGPEALDRRFGYCGVRPVRIPRCVSEAQRVAVATDGSAVIAGTVNIADGPERLLLQRLHPDGSVDRSFADGGLTITQIPPVQGEYADVTVTGLAIAADGKIVVSGYLRDLVQDENTAGILARFNADGALDSSFGSGGFVVERLQGSAAELADVVIAPRGKILAAGVRNTARLDDPKGPQPGLVVARFNPDGRRDATFGSNGVAAPDLGDLEPTRANAIRILVRGRILVGPGRRAVRARATDVDRRAGPELRVRRGQRDLAARVLLAWDDRNRRRGTHRRRGHRRRHQRRGAAHACALPPSGRTRPLLRSGGIQHRPACLPAHGSGAALPREDPGHGQNVNQ